MPNLGEILRTNLPQDVMSQIEDVVGDDFDWDVVPRSRLNKVIAQRNKLLNNGNNNNNSDTEGSEGSVDLKDYIKKEEHDTLMQQEAQRLQGEYDKSLLNMRKQYAALDKLNQMHAKDPQLILKSQLIDLEKLSFDDSGELQGFSEQADPLKESKSYLFGEEDKHQRGTGKNSGSEGDQAQDALDSKINNVFEHMGIQMTQQKEG